MPQNPLKRLIDGLTGVPQPSRDKNGQRVPWATTGPDPNPRAKAAFEGVTDLVLGGLGVNDPLSAEATPATGLGSLLGMLGPAAAIGGIKNAGRGLYSRLDDAAKLIPAGGAHPNKVLSTLKNNASGEELAWRGVPEWLQAQGETKVTREALEAQLAKRPAPMPETKVLGGEKNILRGKDGWTVDGQPATLEEAMDAKVPDNPPRYEQYQVPGGTNYRETLSVMPEQPRTDLRYSIADSSGVYQPSTATTRADAIAEAGDPARVREIASGPDPVNYRGSHFTEPNVLVHTRSNDRTLPTGEKGTLVENVQSDWHQAGRKGGYGASKYSETDALANALEPGSYAVPDAPFKDSWPALGLKQEVLDAVARDHDWIGITPAATLNTRGEAISEAFQDQRLPLTLEKILQPFGGGKVERGVVNAGPPRTIYSERTPAYERAVESSPWRIMREDPSGERQVASVLRSPSGIQDTNTVRYVKSLVEKSQSPATTDAFIARLTPEMRAQIKQKGLPLLMALLAAQQGLTPPVDTPPSIR